MKKRVLCIILALVMVLPLVLASCNNKSEEDKMKEIILGTDGEETERAYTLSLWIPTNKITIKGKTADLGELSQKEKKALELEYPEVYSFLLRIEAVEEAINKILISRNLYTHIDIVPVYDEYYEEAVKDRFASMSATSLPGAMNQRGESDEYENQVVEEAVGDSTLYKLLYRPVDSKQLDLFLIRSYDDYASYIESNYLLPLDTPPSQDNNQLFPSTNYLTTNGSYTSIFKLIRTIYRSQMLYGTGANKYTYALPNNHLYADEYQYILVNKELFQNYTNEEKAEEMKTIADLQGFIEHIGTLNDDSIVGLVANYNDAHGFVYADNDLLMGGTQGSTSIGSVYDDEGYNAFVSLYKDLEGKGLVANELTEGKKAAVQIVYGTSKDVEEYADDYVLIKSAMPVVDTENMYSSMLAISMFSVNYDRSMQMLNLLMSDSSIRTLIQYGIENEDYVIETVLDENKKEIEKISVKDGPYKDAFEVMYTGNSYYTYPSDDKQIDEWDYEKATNLDAVVSSYIRFDYYLENGDLSEEEKAFLSETRDSVMNLINKVDNEVENMTLDEYTAFLEVYKTNIIAKLNAQKSYAEQIVNKNNDILLNNEKIAKKQTEIALAYGDDTLEGLMNQISSIDAQIKELTENAEENKEKIEELQESLDELNKKVDNIKSLEKELSDLNSTKEKLEKELSTLQEQYDNITTEINDLKAKSEIAFELKSYEDYLKTVEIYQKVLTFCK